LAGVFADESLFEAELSDFVVLDFLCFLWCGLPVDELDWSVEDGVVAGASAAKTGPAIRARAMTGTSFLNIDVVSESDDDALFRLDGVPDRPMRCHERPQLRHAPALPRRGYYDRNRRAQVPYDRNVMLVCDTPYLIDN
jgi:hypothetical protein